MAYLRDFGHSMRMWLQTYAPQAKLSSVIIVATAGIIGLRVLRVVKRMVEKTPLPGPGVRWHASSRLRIMYAQMSFLFRLAFMSPEARFKEIFALPDKFGKICCFK